VAVLAGENERLRRELAASQLREEIALLLPGRAGPGEKKAAVVTAAAADPAGAVPGTLAGELPAGRPREDQGMPRQEQRVGPTAEPAAAAPLGRRAEPAHQQRLRAGLSGRGGRQPPRPRDASWQEPARALEQVIRAEAAALADGWGAAQVSLLQPAALLGVPPRTLRDWRQGPRRGRPAPCPLDRPPARAGAERGSAVVGWLHAQGPWVGVAVLRGAFPGVARAELRDLLGVYRRLWSAQHPREQRVLHWQRPGTVWAVDFTEVAHPIDGLYPYVLAVRDLASGMQLAWQPVADATAAAVRAELGVLFTVHGAPLVLKSDNGPAFRAEAWKAQLRLWQVWPLYSPPGEPGYNGAIEASIGALKRRTQQQAERRGQADGWTGTDLTRARALANATARPRGARGPTPDQAWAARRAVSAAEQEAWAAGVRDSEARARRRAGLAWDAALSHEDQAALQWGVLQQALVEGGLLTITRRRIPHRFFGQNPANFT
jgi:hypothetical protein